MKQGLPAHGKLQSKSINFRMPNLRILAGIILIAASFFSAYLISHSNDRMITVWSAVNDLAPGRIIEPADVAPIQVLMPENASLYLNANYPIAGSQVLRSVGASELIPAYSLSRDLHLDLRKVPIALSRSRLPMGIGGGSVIDLYAIPKNQLNTNMEFSKSEDSQLLLSSVSVDGIDTTANKLGGDIGLTILVPSIEVSRVILAMADSEFVVVRRN